MKFESGWIAKSLCANECASVALEHLLQPVFHVRPFRGNDGEARGVARNEVGGHAMSAQNAFKLSANAGEAARERWLRESVCRHTRCTCYCSNACVSMSSWASVLAAVRMAEAVSQV